MTNREFEQYSYFEPILLADSIGAAELVSNHSDPAIVVFLRHIHTCMSLFRSSNRQAILRALRRWPSESHKLHYTQRGLWALGSRIHNILWTTLQYLPEHIQLRRDELKNLKL